MKAYGNDFDFSSETLLERAAKIIFDSVKSVKSGIALAVVDRQGSCLSSDSELFSFVFADQKLLQQLCSRLDDGSEPVVSNIGDYMAIGSTVSCGNEEIGYCVMLIKDCSPEKAFEYMDFVEIILSQFSFTSELLSRLETQTSVCQFGNKVAELCSAVSAN